MPVSVVDSGRLTAPAPAGQNVLNDSTKRWAVDIHVGKVVRVITPTGRSHTLQIAGNAASALALTTNFTETIPISSAYEISEFDLDTVLRVVFGAGVNIDLPAEFQALKDALAIAMEVAVDTGTATGGSNTTIIDTAKSWAINMWAGATYEVVIAGVHYLGLVVSNTADTITFAALPGGAIVVAGSEYSLKRPVTVDKATTPVIYNVTMTLADTEYSQALPANTKKYTIQTRDGTAFRMAFETGRVAAPTEPYFSVDTDGFHHEDLIEPPTLTLYFACGSALKVIEIIAWS